MCKRYLSLLLLLLASLMFACNHTPKTETLIEPGVSKSLADQRKADIEELSYRLHFDIPEKIDQPIEGAIQISFRWSGEGKDLVLDFKNSADQVTEVLVGYTEVPFTVESEHIIIPGSHFSNGNQEINIGFIAGEQALNRNEDFLYTLFVPDKASTAFPCFEQPNLKAAYELSLEIPESWTTVANYPLVSQDTNANRSTYQFAPTLPISTYLFAFAAGEFESITDTLDGRTMTLYHRETDEEKISRNAPEVFDLHAKSLAWLEDYTNIPYPFEKFDFALLPAFQFGGMEHPGAIFYKQRSLFLDKSATINQKMSRNSLIAHETAHMWFGDLVTMDWFNDVWLKEVFANFMAAKMVNPNFPTINHKLRFLQRHQPAAYGEDRTLGSHPIQQELANLNQASLLYGRIIYQKAPVVMKQLEAMMGEELFQQGLQEYLNTFSFDNATWDDLVGILDQKTEINLTDWSQAWVKESGMPHIKADLVIEENKIASYSLTIENETSGNNIWKENSAALIGWGDEIDIVSVSIKEKENVLASLRGLPAPDFILPNVSEKAYGYFELDKNSQTFLLENVHTINDDFAKLSAWFSLWEGMLRNNIEPEVLMQTIQKGLSSEKEQLGLSSRLSYLRQIYWGFFNQQDRLSKYPHLGMSLWKLMEGEENVDKKKSFYDTFVAVAQSEEEIELLLELWQEKRNIKGLDLSENDYTSLAYELAVRKPEEADAILQEQLSRITNPDRKAAMEFIIPALSDKVDVRDAFFERLKDKANRQKEPWVNRALGYLHHPLRAKSAEKYLLPSLELVQELQKTNGIFFPKSWTSTILNGHRSPEANQIVNDFLTGLPMSYPYKLKNKILQAADLLDRKAK